ncbi:MULTISPECIES: hypothetical protein [Vibrio harveyi group]|nr:hypothetical protein [Vibrio parahaemolyticus]ELB2781266.1 hypothetical protein [Vibrio alginolyticus]ELN6907980.1 hypothetical protein [Vibrio alginolyticus]MDG2600563.1 hypothetical protein [Vibrio parahaemolyticus]MDL2005451.1 hypothetical protein [Vibrio parahaemolyticus]HCG6533778.1 hypothetical protein [Vibrio parahaemolyticus]
MKLIHFSDNQQWGINEFAMPIAKASSSSRFMVNKHKEHLIDQSELDVS